MAPMTRLLTSPLAQDLSLTLMHSVWQGVILASVLAGLLNSSRKIRSATRYGVGIGTLVVFVLCLFVTLAVLRLDLSWDSVPMRTPRIESTDHATSPVENPLVPHVSHRVEAQTSHTLPWQSWALSLWGVGVFIMLIRMFNLLRGVHRLTQRSRPLNDTVILDLIDAIKTKLRISRRVLVVTGDCILSPGVIGFFRPILLLPMSLATGVPSEDLEAILLHELAHIRRYDYLVNFFQMVIEALLFFNPAVWWINRQIRLEREACCDALAAETMGQRLRYAEILMQWSGQAQQPHNQVAAMVGFSTAKDSSLAERIKRLVLPNHKPRIHLSLLSTVGMFVLAIVLLAALWKTTDTAVVIAAKMLTPAQRANTIDRIDQSFGAQAVQYGPEDRITIGGTVRAKDGSSLPDDFYMSILGQSSTLSSSSGTRVRNGTFHHTMTDYFHTFYLLVECPDFAPTYAGPFHLEPGQTIDNIDVLLTHGFPGVIEVVDAKGDPIEGAAVKGHYEVFKTFWSGSQDLQGQVTDDHGRIIVQKAIARPITLDILATGYQYVRDLSIRLEPNQPNRLTLTPSLPTTGVVLDDETGTPIPGAALRVWKDHTNQVYHEGRGDIWATTDAQGRFALSTLSHSQPYTLIVETPDHQYVRIKDMIMGTTNHTIRLTPKRHIRGHVLGEPPVERLYDRHSQSWTQQPILKFSYGFQDEYTYAPGRAALSESNGRFTFDISDVYGDTIRIETGDKELHLNFGEKDLEDLVIDLRPLTERIQDSNDGRMVVLQFDPPEGIDCNDFQISVSVISQADREAGHWGQWTQYRIQNNRIELTVPTPGLLSYSRGSFDPYRDKGTYIRPFWIEGQNLIPVSSGKSPLAMDVPLHPAGTIYGQIHIPEQRRLMTSSQDVDIQLLVASKPEYMTSRDWDLEIPYNGYWRPTDRYSIAPVPLGGTYVLVARHQFGWIKSPPMRLEEDRSILEFDLNFPEGLDVTGTVTSDQGQALTNVSVSLQFTTPIGRRLWSTPHHIIHTDHQGHFTFAGVNPDIAGTYSLRVRSPEGYAPVADKPIEPRQRPYTIKLKPAAK